MLSVPPAEVTDVSVEPAAIFIALAPERTEAPSRRACALRSRTCPLSPSTPTGCAADVSKERNADLSSVTVAFGKAPVRRQTPCSVTGNSAVAIEDQIASEELRLFNVNVPVFGPVTNCDAKVRPPVP